MTYQQLLNALAGLSAIDLAREAVVWPPKGCPAAEAVPVTSLDVTCYRDDRSNTVTLLTGKAVDEPVEAKK